MPDVLYGIGIFITPVNFEFSITDFFYVFTGYKEIIFIIIYDQYTGRLVSDIRR